MFHKDSKKIHWNVIDQAFVSAGCLEGGGRGLQRWPPMRSPMAIPMTSALSQAIAKFVEISQDHHIASQPCFTNTGCFSSQIGVPPVTSSCLWKLFIVVLNQPGCNLGVPYDKKPPQGDGAPPSPNPRRFAAWHLRRWPKPPATLTGAAAPRCWAKLSIAKLPSYTGWMMVIILVY